MYIDWALGSKAQSSSSLELEFETFQTGAHALSHRLTSFFIIIITFISIWLHNSSA